MVPVGLRKINLPKGIKIKCLLTLRYPSVPHQHTLHFMLKKKSYIIFDNLNKGRIQKLFIFA